MGSSTAIAGNAPTLSPHTHYYVNKQYAPRIWLLSRKRLRRAAFPRRME